MSQSNANHGERIVALETGQKALQESLQKLADIVAEQSDSQMREHNQTRKEISMLADKLGNVGRPNYAVIISACSLVCMLVAAILSPLYLQQRTTSVSLEKLTERFHEHEMLPVHPVAGAILSEREKAREAETELRDKLNRAQHDLLKHQLNRP